MGSRELFYYYKETRVNVEATSTTTVVHAQVPAVSGGRRVTGSGRANGSSEGRGHGGGHDNGGGDGSSNSSSSHDNYTEEERAYRAKNLASEAGIFQRRHHGAPRSFLWRVLERGHVLSLRVMDIGKTAAEEEGRGDGHGHDYPLTLHLHFPRPIRAGCVALADPAQHDALTVLVLDETAHLHHLQLRPDVFRKRSLAEADLGEAWTPYLSTTFHFKQPRRLVAVSAREFVVALHDGGLIQFRRVSHPSGSGSGSGSDAAAWKEAFHSPVSLMQGLRSILPFQGGPTIKHGGASLEMTAAASAVVSTLGVESDDEDSNAFLFSVCLDHRLRVWNVARGEVCYAGDILGMARDASELGKWTIDPAQTNLVRVLALGEGTALVVTYSPVGAGAFMFWRATEEADGKVEVVPLAEAPRPLVPRTPTASDVWTLADFAVAATGAADGRKLSLWVLWKNNLIYRVMQLETAPDSLEAAWGHDWLGVHTEAAPAPAAPTSGPSDPTDAAEKWLDLIFYPGRFSRATLETALAMYERGLGGTPAVSSSSSSSSSKNSLMESVCAVLGSTAALERTGSGAMDYELFRSASEIQWRRFYRLLVELDKQRGEALALAVDGPGGGLAWVVGADSTAALRECSELERLCHNGRVQRQLRPQLEGVARLLAAGAAFVDSFSDGMVQQAEAALRAELFDDASRADEERVQRFYERAGFWRHLAEDECAQVVDVLGDGFGRVDEATYAAFFALLEDVHRPVRDGSNGDGDDDNNNSNNNNTLRFPFTQLGQKLVVRGIQDAAELLWQLLFRQLILLAHMAFELDDDDDPAAAAALHARLDIGRVYSRLVDGLKRLALVRWLAKTEFSVALTRSARASLGGSFSDSFSGSLSSSFGSSPSSSRRPGAADENQTVVTVLEASVGHLLGLGEPSGVPLASLLTDIVVDVCSARGSIELDAAMIQCMLLKRGRPDLALQLGPFADDDPFSTYVQARTHLALRDFDAAARLFQKASVGLSAGLRHPPRHSAGLLDDAEWNLFYSGLARYYVHVVALYDRHKAYSFVVDFARLSLQFRADAGGDSGIRTEIRTEMLSRLFAAATALSRFDTAHTALLALGATPAGRPLQRAGLRSLVEKMAETGHVAALLALPLPGLRDAVEDVLEQRCRAAALDVQRGTPWHQILYAWRIAHGDYRGAAAALLHRLQRLQQAGAGDAFLAAAATAASDDVLDTPVTRQYLMLINTLSCVEPKQAWIYTEDGSGPGDSGPGDGRPGEVRISVEADGETTQATQTTEDADADADAQGNAAKNDMGALLKKAAAAQREPWRKVVTLADLRKQYQAELDRIAAIQNNQFGFEDVAMED